MPETRRPSESSSFCLPAAPTWPTAIPSYPATASVVTLSLTLCGLLFLVQDRIAPAANQEAQTRRDQILGRAPRTHGLPAMGRWGFGPEGRRLYHYRLFDADQDQFQGFSVFTLDRRSTPRVLDHRFAARAGWDGERWLLEQGWFRSFPADGSIEGVTFRRYDIEDSGGLDPPEALVSRESRVRSLDDLAEQMSLTDLRQRKRTLEQSGYDTTQLEVAIHGKLAHSFTPLVMVVLGLPFAFRVGRRGSLYGIGVALVLVLVYWAVLAIFNALGLETILEPWVAAWAPNVIFGLLGVYLMLYIRT